MTWQYEEQGSARRPQFYAPAADPLVSSQEMKARKHASAASFLPYVD